MKLQDYDLSVRVVEVTRELIKIAERDEVIEPVFTGTNYRCSICDNIITEYDSFCRHCGQRLAK